MAPAKETAEEQLLRMIEGPQKRGAPFKLPASPSLRQAQETGRALATRAWRLVVPPQRQADVFLWNLRLASRLLWLVLAALGAYVVVDLVLAKPAPPPAHPAGAPPSGASTESPAAPFTMKPLADYVTALTQRNPFTGSAGGVVEQAAVSKTARRQLEDLATGLSVVGIDRGPNPVALIESKSQQRTFVAKVGDEVNGLRITRIGPEGVVVSYEGEELLLH